MLEHNTRESPGSRSLCQGLATATSGDRCVTRTRAQQFVLAVFALALMLAPLASVAPTMASTTPDSFHWGRKQPEFTVQAGNNVGGVWNGILRDVISDWNKSDVVTIKEVAGNTSAQSCNDSKGKIEVCSFRYGTQEGWLGLTRLFFDKSGKHVDAATVQMNDSFFEQNGGQYNDDAARLHTMCHEMGHAIGLDHVSSTSCMNNSQHAVFNYTHPINKDYRQLERIYDHKDSTTTLAGNQKDKDKKDKKGKKGKKNKNRDRRQGDRDRNDRRDRDNRNRSSDESFFDPASLPDESVAVETLDDGRKVVTYITWADE
jgi:hypothetical protein